MRIITRFSDRIRSSMTNNFMNAFSGVPSRVYSLAVVFCTIDGSTMPVGFTLTYSTDQELSSVAGVKIVVVYR